MHEWWLGNKCNSLTALKLCLFVCFQCQFHLPITPGNQKLHATWSLQFCDHLAAAFRTVCLFPIVILWLSNNCCYIASNSRSVSKKYNGIGDYFSAGFATFPLRTDFVLSLNRIAVHWSLQTFEHYTRSTYKIDILGTAKEVSIRYESWTKTVRAMSPDMRGISAMCEKLNYKAHEGQTLILPLWWLPVFWRAELIICELRSVCSGLDRRQRDVINVIHLCFSVQFIVFFVATTEFIIVHPSTKQLC